MIKQTALEWFKENLKEYSTPSLYEIDWDEFNQLFDQAKEMEKEQMWDYIKTHYVIGKNSLSFHKEEFKNYYNETYGGKQ